jgi:hypothetical protein
VTWARSGATVGACALFVVAATVAGAQQQPKAVSPEAPPDGASVGTKPRFVIRVEGGDVEKLKFRIELSRDDFKTTAYTFDGLKDDNGWAVTALADQGAGAVYFSPKPLAGGGYLWRVASWDGLSWMDGDRRFRIQIDDVPPADVDGVRMTRNPEGSCVRIRWEPVTTDRDGGPERIAQYHVYRYTARGSTQPIRLFEAGRTAELEFEDCDAAALNKPILFYRIVAEDQAGNIPGRKF